MWTCASEICQGLNLNEKKIAELKQTYLTQLICNGFHNRPTPEMSWQKDGDVLPSSRTSFQNFKKTLKIFDVNEADGGNYRCTAANNLDTVHHIIKVTVKGMTFDTGIWPLCNQVHVLFVKWSKVNPFILNVLTHQHISNHRAEQGETSFVPNSTRIRKNYRKVPFTGGQKKTT